MLFLRLRALTLLSLPFLLLSFLPLLWIDDLFHLENSEQYSPLAFLLFFLVTALAFWIILPLPSFSLLLALAIFVAGSISNLFYRLFLGPVPDYIPLPSYYANVADFLVVLGAFFFIIFLTRELIKEKRLKRQLSHP